MVMIARVNIRQFVLFVFNLCDFRQFHAVDAIPKAASRCDESSKVGNYG